MRLNENYTFEGAADRCGQDLASFRCVSVFRMSPYRFQKVSVGVGKRENLAHSVTVKFCLVHKNETQKMFKEDNSLLRHKVGHDAHVRDVIDENITIAMCGVKSDCPFNELGYWHVTNNLVVDVMHDLLEGWCATETYLILHQYIFKDKFLTLSVLNDRISDLNYGKCDSRCKPTPIKQEKLSNLDGSNGQSASQMCVLMRILPLLIGDNVPYNNDFWNLYLLMLTIIDTLMAPVISLSETYAFAENIADHHKLFLILFPNRHLTPKMHFALHYPRIIRQLGPLVSCQVIYSQFGLAIHQNDHQARRRFIEWAQNEIAVVPDFHKRILFSDEEHFWLNGYVNKQNCRIWSEANPQVYVETPLHPEKLTVWCALWAGGILLQKR
ncbi:uncharacterized protein LOC106175700 [Trichonephila clavipes]|nr:uncharacterized protein LOC106175700 [Trichonephila clavipes]